MDERSRLAPPRLHLGRPPPGHRAPKNPAYVAAIFDAIRDAEQILKRIDREWPAAHR